MIEFSTLLQQGAGNAWLFIPSAILLGALHGLEPGHSKTMMAAFIIAVSGTVGQAVMLGLAATVSHTAVVWVVALVGMHYGSQWNAEATEPYFQLASAVLIIAVALWMMWRTWSHQRGHAAHGHDHSHDHGHDHGHEHEHHHSHDHQHNHDHDHEHDHSHDHAHAHEHPHNHGHQQAHIANDTGLDVSTSGYQDPHELAHANDIRRRFSGQEITNGQILMFGLTGGLIPCPASITILLLCLQLKKVALGATLVLCFSIGLALTMVLSGVLAALSVKHVSTRWSGFGDIARKAPYISGGLILVVGLYVGYLGASALMV